MAYVNNKGTDQPEHPCSLISAFDVRCLNSIIPVLAIPKISVFKLVSVAVQAGLSLTWSETPMAGFLVMSQIMSCALKSYNQPKKYRNKRIKPQTACLPCYPTDNWQMNRIMTKPTKWHVCPAKTQISLGICPVWSVFAVRMKKAWVLSYPFSAQRGLWSDWVDAEADLRLCWAHSHFVGFVMKWLKCPHPGPLIHKTD